MTGRSAVFVAIVGVAIATSARAEMPNYDVEGYCKKIASIGGAPSQMMLNACLQREQSSYNGLKATWDSVPESMRNYCDGIARIGGDGSFMMLDACVQREQAASSANGEFKFKR